MSRPVQRCTRCIYDARIPRIAFDAAGVCSYCRQYDEMDGQYPTGEEGRRVLDAHVAGLKAAGRGKPYDVVIGVSGGCDSSYMVHLARETFGLRVLAAHFDNTYNSRVAVENIAAVLGALDVDLFTHVVDNAEMQRVTKAFFRASVPEVDTPTDLAIATVHYMAASKFGVRTIWDGHSFRTEGISPPGWFYMDAKYIQQINKRYGEGPIRTLPVLWLGRWLRWMVLGGIKRYRPLYNVDYDKEAAKALLTERYGWQWYGGHHMENRTATFVNNYYLPTKFGIDLRRSELSALVRVGALGREEALERLAEAKPFDVGILDEIKRRVGFTDAEWDAVMAAPLSHYTLHPTYKPTFERMRPLFFALYRAGYVTRSFYEKFCVLHDDPSVTAEFFASLDLPAAAGRVAGDGAQGPVPAMRPA